MHLIDKYRTFHPKAAEYIFFSSAHGTFSRIDHVRSQNGTFSRIDHMLGHKTSLNKFKKIGIISSIFSDHSGMQLEIKYKKKTGKSNNMGG